MSKTNTVLRTLEAGDYSKGEQSFFLSQRPVSLRRYSLHALLVDSLPISCVPGYLELLSQLTKVGDYDEAAFQARFTQLQSLPDMYKVVVIEGEQTAPLL